MKTFKEFALNAFVFLVTSVVFLTPFAFIAVNALKDKPESALLSFTLPTKYHFLENFMKVIEVRNYILIKAFLNSAILTVTSVAMLVIVAAMAGFVMQRKPNKWAVIFGLFILAGLMTPPAVVPTIWLLQKLRLFKTMHGMILIEVAYNLSFTIMLYSAFIATIPKELDEAAVIDGAKPLALFFKVILPLLKPVTVTVVVIQSVIIFNDFTNPLYYLPGKDNITVQLTLFSFQSMYVTSYNLLFMNILIIIIPPLIVFLFFSRQIISGMMAGSVKG